MSQWSFFTNYGHILFLISRNPDQTAKEMASIVGITERATQKIIHDLEAEGYISITKQGRKNHYKVIGNKKLRHDVEKNCQIKELIGLICHKKRDL